MDVNHLAIYLLRLKQSGTLQRSVPPSIYQLNCKELTLLYHTSFICLYLLGDKLFSCNPEGVEAGVRSKDSSFNFSFWWRGLSFSSLASWYLTNSESLYVSMNFLILCLLLFFSGLMVAFSTNPVESVLFLILAFFNAGAILISFNAEFLGLIFIIVYVGAIAVLFLFVIMMLNVKIHENIFSKLFSKNFRNTIIALFFVYLVYVS